MTESPTMPTLATQILNLARHNEVKEIEASWLEFVEKPPTETDFYTQFVQALVKNGAEEAAHNFMVMLLEALQGRSDWKLMYRILGIIAGNFPQSEAIRKFTSRALRENFSGQPNLDEMLRASKIDADSPVDQAIKRFKNFLRLSPGNVFQHKTWGEGVVKSLDLRTGKLTLDFATEKNKPMTFEGVKNFLTYLPPDHFLARRAKEPEKLWELADENPLAVIKMAVECSGRRLKQAALKQLLVGVVVPASSWNSWWTRARRELKLDAMTDFDSKGGAHAEIILRDRPKTFEEEIEDVFFDAEADLSQRVAAFQNLADAQKGKTLDPKLLGRMLKRLEEDYQIGLVGDHKMSRTDQLQSAFLAQDIRAAHDQMKGAGRAIPMPETILAEMTDFAELGDVDNVTYAMRALKHMMAREGKAGIEKAVEILPSAPIKLAQAIWRELDEEHHVELAVKALEGLFENSLENPSTYMWAVKAIVEANWNHIEDYFPISWLIPHLLDDLEMWQQTMDDPRAGKEAQATAKSLASRAKSLLQAKHFAALCRAAEAMSLDQAQRLRKSLQHHKGLSDTIKAAADKQLLLTRKDLDTAPPLSATPDSEQMLCTEKMRSIKLKELAELNTVIIPANSREIEEARQEGDLKENAGYHAAKDKQKMLMQQTLQLQEALSNVRVITAAMVNADAIAFGTAFEADNIKSGQVERFTILGRWEAVPEQNILSCLAPMVKQFLGKKVGEEITIKHPGGGETPYRIRAITNALATGEWDVKVE